MASSLTIQSLVTDLVTETGGSVRSEEFAKLARLAILHAVQQASYYNFREETWQDLVGVPVERPWDSTRFALVGRDVVPMPPAQQHRPLGLVQYDHVSLYRPLTTQLEPGVDADGSVNASVTTLVFERPIPGAIGLEEYTLSAPGPVFGTWSITQGANSCAVSDSMTGPQVTAALAAAAPAAIPFTAIGGPLNGGLAIGLTAINRGTQTGALTLSRLTGGNLGVDDSNVLVLLDITVAAPFAVARTVRFWYRRRALMPPDDQTIIALDDTYLERASKMHMHELLSSRQLGGDPANHAYQVGQLAKELEGLKRVRQSVRINQQTWRAQ